MAEHPRIWLTRPQEDSAAMAAQLAQDGIDFIIAPVLTIVPRAMLDMPAKPDAVLLTSRNAVAVLAQLPGEWRSVPVFCVGAATAAVVRDAGFGNVMHGESDILELLPALVAHLSPHARVLYLAGDHTRVDVPVLLAAKQIQVETVIAYEARAEMELSPEIRDALDNGKITGIVFFSVRTAQIAASLLGGCNVRGIEAYCLSLAVAEAAGALPWRGIHACHAPTVDAMLNLIVSRTNANLL